jgi:enoyl-CoA hydratase/carnithine racemase
MKSIFMSANSHITIEHRESGSCTVMFNRPAKRNCISLAMWEDLGNLFADLDVNRSVRTIILTGAGGHFSSGADISEFESLRNKPEIAEEYEAAAERALQAIYRCSKPTIAAVSGVCVGGGCSLALACDIRIADRSARVGITASRIGIVYGQFELTLLLSAVSLANAKRIMFTGEIFPAERAHELQLVSDLTDDPLSKAKSISDQICQNAPLSISGAKFILSALHSGEIAKQSTEITRRIREAVESEDYVEGRRAFAEKRPPRFTGR